MSSHEPETPDQADWRKPEDQLRHWSTYASVGDWFNDYRGYVPIQMAHALSNLMQDRGLTFPEVYAQLLGAGKIIHLDPADDAIPEPDTN